MLKQICQEMLNSCYVVKSYWITASDIIESIQPCKLLCESVNSQERDWRWASTVSTVSHLLFPNTQLQSLTNMLHFLSRGAEPQLASPSTLCLKLHSQHSSWQIPKNTLYHFIVLDREMRKLLHCYHNKAYYVCWWIGNDFCYTVRWLLLSKDN